MKGREKVPLNPKMKGRIRAMDRKYQKFISSTYEDLKDIRKTIQDEISEVMSFAVNHNYQSSKHFGLIVSRSTDTLSRQLADTVHFPDKRFFFPY